MKKAFMIAGSLILLGAIVFFCALAAANWKFKNLSAADYETHVTKISEDFNEISISTRTANIAFAASEDGECRVECYEDKKETHAVAVENGALTVKIGVRKAWHYYIGFDFEEPKITVYLPKTQFSALRIESSTGSVEISKDYTFERADISLTTGDVHFGAAISEALKIKTTTGNIGVDGVFCGAADLSSTTGNLIVSGATCGGDFAVNVSTGNAHLTNVTCENLISDGSTGDLALKNVVSKNKISVERSTGNVTFIGCDAAEIYVKTSTGDVTGSLLSGKSFVTDTSTGEVNMPASSGGKCEIKTSTGDIKISVR